MSLKAVLDTIQEARPNWQVQAWNLYDPDSPGTIIIPARINGTSVEIVISVNVQGSTFQVSLSQTLTRNFDLADPNSFSVEAVCELLDSWAKSTVEEYSTS